MFIFADFSLGWGDGEVAKRGKVKLPTTGGQGSVCFDYVARNVLSLLF